MVVTPTIIITMDAMMAIISMVMDVIQAVILKRGIIVIMEILNLSMILAKRFVEME